ncbi:2-oxo-4-hydroxy-4-carboxy-5-ureidoimidazoline decarboxylase [Pseudoalteromonas sp. MMG010]|uniref:2-oxo-4-hydroxy-4-carboxy-5-ureidoimidazoline decarboxylase n=1 Tax=Pseudoalteromonas sp. MMG010 TaxID=2822685 RepID=UPI001B39F147|nr:2-oxo-4-hydroxy-4-carboxy-5-ureidoimidazoline decarboxylase [Pseudoalteromonas sp. MMG010]MBQ4832925.1 2-oxo-4-hydroxy-4-carboxy-5-ureidoimidazoline decarboxylase [Pseudoalteromonas sp. MMG010]
MSKIKLNDLSKHQAQQELTHCCVAPRWVEGMMALWPFNTQEQIFTSAETVWQQLGESDYLAAFEGHPQIGDLSTLSKKYAATADKAGHEQSAMSEADKHTLEQMIRLNHAYLEKFGFIFIVCATGKSAAQMLTLIEQRINNDRDEELMIAAGEQAKITKIRLEKLL